MENSSEINYLNQSKNRYVNMKNNIINALNKLKNAYNKLNDISDLVVNGYSIDGSSADNNYLVKTKNEVMDSYNKLNNILGSVNNKIKDIESDIKILEE